MTTREKTLGLDLDWVGDGDRRERAARIVLADATGFTRHGGAPTLTGACTTPAAFEREVQRLGAELAALGAAGRAALEGEAATPRPAAAPSETTSPPPAKPAVLATDLRVRDVMTRDVKTLRRNDRIAMADELMKIGRFRHVVVLDDDDRVAGVISQRDIFYGALAWSIGQSRSAHEHVLESQPAKEVMRSDPRTIDPDVPLADAARVLMEHKIGCLPVLEGDRLVGILTEGDFLALLAASARAGS